MADETKIIDPFINIPVAPVSDQPSPPQPVTWAMGYGGVAFKIDKRGIWLGANDYDDAPFRVSMAGVAHAEGYLAESTTTLDDIADGASYKRVLATAISAGKILLSESIGNIGNIADGGGYSKVLTTSISGGLILLSQTVGNLDNIADGGTYGRPTFAQLTGATRAVNGLNGSYQIIKGFVNSQLSSLGLPANGVRIDVNGIYGSRAGGVTFYINTNGDAYFSGTVAASTITGGAIYGAYISGALIEGSTFQTGSSGYFIRISNGNADRIQFYLDGTIVGLIKADASSMMIGPQVSKSMYVFGDTVFIRATSGGGTTLDVDQFSVNLGTLNRMHIVGTGGNGYLGLPGQSAQPGAPGSGLKMWVDGFNNVFFKRSDGKNAKITVGAWT